MMTASGTDLARQLHTAERRKKLRAMALTLPLLAFLVVFFLVPLASLLVRAVENPEVADALPRTGQALSGWDRQSPPLRRRMPPCWQTCLPSRKPRRSACWHAGSTVK